MNPYAGTLISDIERMVALRIFEVPLPRYAAYETFFSLDLRGTCQNWYDQAFPCGRPASITEIDTSCSYCVNCWREQL